MRILVTSHYALPHRGGIEVLVDQLARQWVSQGNDVVHLTSNIGQPSGFVMSRATAGYRTITVPASNILERYAVPFPMFHPMRLAKAVGPAIDNADVVCVQGMLYLNSVSTVLAAKQRGRPVVICEYPGLIDYKNAALNLVERSAFETLGRLSGKNCDAAVVINRAVGNFMRKYLRSETPLHLIPVGVDTGRFRPEIGERRLALRTKWHLHRPTVLFAGRLVPRKGIATLEALSSPAYELIVCGRGGYRLEQEGVRFLGFVADEDLLELFQAADLFVLLTDGDDFPLVGLEAMACGLPLVAFDTKANREYHDDSTASLVPLTIESVRSALVGLAEDVARRSEMSVSARRRAVDHFDWSVSAGAYLALFQDLLAKVK